MMRTDDKIKYSDYFVINDYKRVVVDYVIVCTDFGKIYLN